MEYLLWLYSLPYDPREPVVCFDERPCQLLGETNEALATRPGKVRRESSTYTRNGTCALLAAIEPLTGRRLAGVYKRRTKREYALFLQRLAEAYPEADRIHLVQDNLNTHNASSLYEYLPADEAFALAQRFVFHYTPKGASWLNMVEIEFSVLARKCLSRRIPSIEKLERAVLTLIQERHKQRVPIHWQFSIETARSKLNRHYRKVASVNGKFIET